jgi:two-component system sensor histidine kinase VanS
MDALTSVSRLSVALRDEREISGELQHKYLSVSLERRSALEDLINEFFESPASISAI